ncbi:MULTISPECIES: AI-2E family transporter [unclassified Microbacterium]|jgi:predicted PurR-regulated permease PerM|uniref:AI-2E family transporter n=1 Tax=unclassified Microbacterium TaxID=2609290 RepID=UPI000CFC05F9|nr:MULTISPECIES: AI-2E family transporter [unclassified Microbacterium]PQZ61137.1 AI-2E family transporter [Microbacterium sp. MYb43]PQZ82348.1 AI-2E family transporter [Microbacterium sp. MYb40]PRB23952.1 AI-2E family transporter [Microbacterium sp. MYb54]PRB30783.1 AI-2E family transporter [Microbacterium sp. MYb50]PRB70795.1 AI-2E family transporter [Microbacterium sp. MYb24]
MKIHNPFRTALVATLGVGLGILLINSVQNLSTVLLYLGTALFLSLGLDPLVSFLERRRLPRWAAVLVTIVAVLGIFSGIVLIVLPVLVDQISQLIAQITAIVQRGTAIDDLKQWMTDAFPNLRVDDVFSYVENWLTTNLTEIGGSIGQGFLVASGAVLSGLFGAFIVLILTIYLTASTPSLKRAVYQLAPASKRDRFIDLSEQITDSVGYYVMGQVTQGVINGVLSAIYLSIIQAPFPAVLAVVAFFFSLIPLVGTLTGSTIIVLACLIPGLGSPATAIAAAIYYLIYMQIEAYIISPRIMSRAVSVPGAVVVVAALAGGSLLGLLGALIAIPVAASILIIYRQVLIPRMNEL